jgi:hypothetical protein
VRLSGLGAALLALVLAALAAPAAAAEPVELTASYDVDARVMTARLTCRAPERACRGRLRLEIGGDGHRIQRATVRLRRGRAHVLRWRLTRREEEQMLESGGALLGELRRPGRSEIPFWSSVDYVVSCATGRTVAEEDGTRVRLAPGIGLFLCTADPHGRPVEFVGQDMGVDAGTVRLAQPYVALVMVAGHKCAERLLVVVDLRSGETVARVAVGAQTPSPANGCVNFAPVESVVLTSTAVTVTWAGGAEVRTVALP